MNALFLLFLWLTAGLTGKDPCLNTEYAAAYPDECVITAPAVRMERTSVTDISNGF